jgi:hypothetical protein
VLLPADDETVGAHQVAVISHAFWQRRLGGNPPIQPRVEVDRVLVGRQHAHDERQHHLRAQEPERGRRHREHARFDQDLLQQSAAAGAFVAMLGGVTTVLFGLVPAIRASSAEAGRRRIVSPSAEFFRTMGTAVLDGRELQPSDNDGLNRCRWL